MSLFPAYSESSSKSDDGPSWLKNSSFEPPNENEVKPVSVSSSEESSSGELRPQSPKRKRKKSKKKKRKKERDDPGGKLFYMDNTPATAPLPQQQLTQPSYRKEDTKKKEVKKKKKKKKNTVENRYFGNEMEKLKKIDIDNEVETGPMGIEEFLKLTESFNKNLREDPHNVSAWLEYVKLQDKGAGSSRGRTEKKMSILDKALEMNPESDQLIHQKMLIAETMYPMDKIALEAKAIVSKYPKNIIGWLWVLNSSQCNLSKMTAPGVLLTYEQVLEGVNKAHKDSKPFLDFVFLCGLFLRQCGLWEQLWTLLELYLELALSTAGSGLFRSEVSLPEVEIRSTEDRIITSGLPVGALWLRVERLREGVYFLPVEDSEDPQRLVFREDMSNLLLPVTTSSSLVLVIYSLILLKVPPLPLTQAFVNYSGILKVPTFLDSVEFILAAKASGGESSYLDIVPELLLGPQYLVENLGRAEYFNFLNGIFNKCIAHCESDRVPLQAWQVRWWRWIFKCQESDPELSSASRKLFLGLAKRVLKQNREEINLYTEYALLESEVGDFDSAIKVLETAIDLRDPPLLTGSIYKKGLYHLYRTYVELLIKKDQNLYRNKIMSALIGLAYGEPVKNVTPRDDLIKKCSERYKHITTEILRDIEDRQVNFNDIIFPDFRVSWIACHSWFLYMTEGVWDCLSLLGGAIKTLNGIEGDKEGNVLDVMEEDLHIVVVEVFAHHSLRSPGNNNQLYELAEKALKCYPNNALFLNIIYSCELSGIKWSKFSTDVISLDSPLASAIVYFMSHSRLTREESTKSTAIARLQNLLERLNRAYERCPLFWRLLLQASSLRDSQDIKRIFYLSLEKCPWVKILYYEAAKILPGDLPEIQDLIVEKELRLHITPEELEILREDS